MASSHSYGGNIFLTALKAFVQKLLASLFCFFDVENLLAFFPTRSDLVLALTRASVSSCYLFEIDLLEFISLIPSLMHMLDLNASQKGWLDVYDIHFSACPFQVVDSALEILTSAEACFVAKFMSYHMATLGWS